MAKRKKGRVTLDSGVKPTYANSFFLSMTEDESVIIHYAWIPPEDQRKRFVSARIACSNQMALDLAERLAEFTKKTSKAKQK